MRRKEFECIGVDVSKKTLDVALYRGKVDWNDGHIKVDNNVSGYKELKKWLRLKNAEKSQLRICMEATGLYTHDFRSWLEQEGVAYYVVDPKRMHHFAPPLSIKGIRQTKTDKADAFRIAIYCSLFHDSMEPSRLPSAAYFKLKRLLAERRQYVKQSVLYKQQLSDISIYDTVSSRMRKEKEVENLKDDIRQTDKEMKSIIDSDPAIKRNYDLLTSIIGVGIVVAVTTMQMAYGGCTLCLSTAWKLQLLDGHLHSRDDVPSGVAQRPVKVKYDQFYAHCVFFQVILIWGMPSSMKVSDDCLNPTLS